jgi:NhaP-type Na+/H+ or K+/H+ antiporter
VLAMLTLGAGAATSREIGRHAVGLFLLGPALGVGAGWVAITLLDQIRRRVGVRRDYESLYALGVAFTAYSAAEAVGGSGFLAAFAAGLVIAALDVELCDCFLDYGEASAEMFLLFTFVAFGTGLIWTGLPLMTDWRVVAFAVIALGVRTAVMLPVLYRAGLDANSRWLIGLFGPRGLSSLLLVLLPVFAGVPGADHLFAITCLVVLLSVVVHGGGIAIYLRRHAAASAAISAPEAVAVNPAPAPTVPAPVAQTAPQSDGAVPERITIDEFRELERSGAPVIVADVRTERSYRDDGTIASGALRLPPDDAVRLAREKRLDQNATLVLYCA